jgi:hypothetical protein
MITRNVSTLALAAVALLLVPTLARAQDQGPDPEEVKRKVLEIERLMKGAEEALARSTDTRSAGERAAEAARKLLDDKAKKETGKSADDLRKEAAGGSKEAKDTLDRLMRAADGEAKQAVEKMDKVLGGGAGASGGAGTGIRELIEKVRGEGKGASDGIRWLLEKTVKQGGKGGGGGGHDPQEKKPDAEDPKKPDQKPEKPDEKPQSRPPSKTEPPKNPEFEQWLAELPPQVRKAYDSQDWDSIPPKWREMLRAWTKKMAEELEQGRR